MNLLLGIDFGTGGCKVTAIGAEDGRLAGEASVEYPTFHDHPGWSEQEPADWWRALCAALRKLSEKGLDLSQVAALALDGSTHNAVLLGSGGDTSLDAFLPDATYRPVRRTIMWTDQRSTAECEALRNLPSPASCREGEREAPPGQRPASCREGEREAPPCQRPASCREGEREAPPSQRPASCREGEREAPHSRNPIFDRCFQMPAPTWTLPQMMWLKAHEPEALARTEHVLFVKDYVRLLLTGDAATDYIEAQGTLLWDVSGSAADSGASGRWDPELLALAGLRPEAMPRIVAPTAVVGGVTATAAAATGLKPGTPVVCGSSDSAVEDYGAGAVEPGDLILKLATAGNVNSMTAEPHPHPKTLTYGHIVPGMWYSVSATNAAALCQRWFRDAFYSTSASAEGAGGGDPKGIPPATAGGAGGGEPPGRCPNLYSLINAEAATSPVGAGGVLFHPYLQGERCPYWDADLRGSFTGVSIASTRGDFSRALMEGVAFSLRDCYRTLEEMRLPVKRIFLIGGGARSALWSEIVANVFDCAVAVPSPGDASFGAALLAGTGIGLFRDEKEAVSRCLRIDRTVTPDPETAAAYAKLFARYRAVHDALAPVYAAR